MNLKLLFSEVGEHSGEVVVITGGHRGIGAEVSKTLLSAGMQLILGTFLRYGLEGKGSRYLLALNNFILNGECKTQYLGR